MTTKRPLIALLLAVLVFTGQGCGGGSAVTEKPLTLTIWNVFDQDDAFKDIMLAYQKVHPNVSFDYRQLRVEEYRDELLRAFAEGTGPDIFAVHNDGVGEYKSLIAPLPATLAIPYTEIKGTIKKEKVTTVRTEATISPANVRRDFVDVVALDAVLPYQATPNAQTEERVWGLPMALDTMVMYVNKDLLNAAGIAQPPQDWTTFQDAVAKLTRVGPENAVVQSGAAIGTSRNVERAFDILTLLMMQNGTQMTDDRGRPTFASYEAPDRTSPGQDAVRFYTDFANPLKKVYAWNADLPPSFDAFVTGRTAFFFGYAYHLPQIRARAPRLNFAIAPMLQIQGGRVVNTANYWLQTVSKSSKNQNYAWDFVQFATRADNVTSYLEYAKKPTARRALIQSQIANEDLSVFVSQVLTAKSWYRGSNATSAEQAFLDLIDDALAGVEIEDAIREAQNKVSQSL
ncbi:hypothetical protein A2856_00775 [Candidatus Uhrbacteria bacterium RIFCSPHIGHO2_01_FULL_63_20]|uniref:Extracellular solute-binding protein n=1 Tax=Candidatus Uhrbacteria bacterium RIFCSPHIGHO2_01_FULL_63_20 TaxID=1802385 RepID=A0A1F7TNB5_9BACT|nr:MAG: hypothetical protein A2856_00775 [Candidatus Uhrbacteria bacterium RIFCSPHIGHO2_01_FULL_63_20]